MKSSDKENGMEGGLPFEEATTVSERKLQANRQNAQKSTGPKTARGKAFSRNNALKHGLFATTLKKLPLRGENPNEYEELFKDIYDYYDPIGRAEESEVKLIAICLLRAERVWRYENAECCAALSNLDAEVAKAEAKDGGTRDKQLEAVILVWESAEKAIEATGEIPLTIKQQMFAFMPDLELLWPPIETMIERRKKQAEESDVARSLSPPTRSQFVALHTVRAGTAIFKDLLQARHASITEAAIGRHAIPDREALDKIVRYQTTNDRMLGHAIDLLERLQRRRKEKEEAAPPPVNAPPSARMTQ